MKITEYLTLFLQSFLIIIFVLLILYSNSNKKIEYFGRGRKRARRRKKINELNHYRQVHINTGHNMKNDFKDKFKDLGLSDNQKLGIQRDLVNHYNYHWRKRQKGGRWRDRGSANVNTHYIRNVYRKDGTLKDLLDVMHHTPTSSKNVSIYTGGNLPAWQKRIDVIYTEEKKKFDDAKAAAEAARLLEEQRNNRHNYIKDVVNEGHVKIDPLFKTTVGRYKSQPTMDRAHINDIKVHSGSTKPRNNWVMADLDRGRTRINDLYNHRQNLLNDEKIRVKQAALANSIEANKKSLKNKQKEEEQVNKDIEKSNREKIAAKKRYDTRLTNYRKLRNHKYQKLGNHLRNYNRYNYHSVTKPSHFLSNTSAYFHKINDRALDGEVSKFVNTSNLAKESANNANNIASSFRDIQ